MTIVWCAVDVGDGGMAMPGGWTMSMMWMRMPGQTWPGAAASFVGMWVVMMAAMMLPSLVPDAVALSPLDRRASEARLGRLTALVGVGILPRLGGAGSDRVSTRRRVGGAPDAGAGAARASRRSAIGAAVLLAGVVQLTPWKARHLALCREAPGSSCAQSGDAAHRVATRIAARRRTAAARAPASRRSCWCSG